MSATGRILAISGLAGAAATTLLVARTASRHKSATQRWQSVTVFRSIDDIGTPEPLAALGDRIHIRTTPAPADRGTELSATAVGGGGVSPGDIRLALRQAKSLLEAGEVLQPDKPGTSHPTILNGALRAVTARAQRMGHL